MHLDSDIATVLQKLEQPIRDTGIVTQNAFQF